MRVPAALTPRRLAAAVAGLVLAAGIWFGAPPLLRQMAFFRVRRVEILGSRYLSGPELVAVMALRPEASLFDPVGPLEDRVFAVTGVREVAIRRRLPGTLRMTIRESEPVALVEREGRLALMDERGWVLPFDPTRAPPDLPVAPADDAVAGLLARLRDVDPVLFAAVVAVSRTRQDVTLETGPHRLVVRADASVEELQNMTAVAQDLAARGRTWRVLDGRFAGRVFVRGMDS